MKKYRIKQYEVQAEQLVLDIQTPHPGNQRQKIVIPRGTYRVIMPSGFEVYIPKEAFEHGYEPVLEAQETHGSPGDPPEAKISMPDAAEAPTAADGAKNSLDT